MYNINLTISKIATLLTVPSKDVNISILYFGSLGNDFVRFKLGQNSVTNQV